MNLFDPIGPLRLAHGQTGSVFPLSLSPGDPEGFIRVVAIFRDGEPLGGDAPTFQIAAGIGGMFTSVDAGAGTIEIPTPNGERAAIAQCMRENADIFLIKFTEIRENSAPSGLRIRNNDPEELTFLGFCSDLEPDTLQPWLQIGNASEDRFPSFVGAQSKTIEVRNFGTAALTFQDELGPIGDEDSSLALRGRPNELQPHQAGFLTFETFDNPRRAMTAVFTLKTNDKISDHAIVRLDVTPTHVGERPPFEPPPKSFCRTGCGCMEFQGSLTATICESCGHSRVRHMPV